MAMSLHAMTKFCAAVYALWVFLVGMRLYVLVHILTYTMYHREHTQ